MKLGDDTTGLELRREGGGKFRCSSFVTPTNSVSPANRDKGVWSDLKPCASGLGLPLRRPSESSDGPSDTVEDI